jgi:hypothetical protein
MHATIDPPTTRKVQLTMTEAEARLLKLFIGKQEPDRVKEVTSCSFDQANTFVNGLYNTLGTVV